MLSHHHVCGGCVQTALGAAAAELPASGVPRTHSVLAVIILLLPYYYKTGVFRFILRLNKY